MMFSCSELEDEFIQHGELTKVIKARDAALMQQDHSEHKRDMVVASELNIPVQGAEPLTGQAEVQGEPIGRTAGANPVTGASALNKDGLRPCPFCRSVRPHADYKTTFFGGLEHYAYCPECRTQGPTFNTNYNQNNSIDLGTAGAVKLWNTRAPSGEAVNQMMVEALWRAGVKLNAYVGVCKDDNELAETVIPLIKEALAAAKAVKP